MNTDADVKGERPLVTLAAALRLSAWPIVARVLRALVMWPLLLIYTLITLGPLLWMVVLSFRTNTAVYRDPFALPDPFIWTNYTEVFQRTHFTTYFLNSVIVVSIALVVIVAFSSMAAYAFARFSFRFSNIMFWAFMATLMVPNQVVLVPLFRTLGPLHLISTRQGLIIVYVAFALPLSIYILRAFFQTIPTELAEAAKIDGADDWRTFWSVMLPVAAPAVTAVATYQFIVLWNEFLFAVVLIQNDNLRTLPLGQMQFNGEYNQDLAGMAAALTMAALPVLALYITFADQFQKGMSAGAVKG
jgi:raffinose/stachyose/melibiose transport system permease protein